MSTVSGLEIANRVEAEWRDRLDAAVKAEREACAKLCEQLAEDPMMSSEIDAIYCAEAIRARSTT